MDEPPFPTPRLLGDRYAIERELGRGGAATVYLARDLRLDTAVAVKVLRAELVHAVGRDRFLREVHIVSRLTHPHILPILDSGETDGRLWYAMPRVEGESLRARLVREKQLPVDAAVRWAREVAGALAHAHARGIVHRDVKPENILIDGEHAWLADFGIARGIDLATAERLTSSGIAVGTPAYMSPEQASGQQEVDGRSDVYSLACVLYESLAGVPPFVGPTPQSVIAQRFAHAAWPITSYRTTVPEHVQQAIERGMAVVAADRCGAEGFGEALTTPAASDREHLVDPPVAGRRDSRNRMAHQPIGGDTRTKSRSRFVRALVVTLLLATAPVLVAVRHMPDLRAGVSARFWPNTLDTTRYLVLPIEGSGSMRLSGDADVALHDAIGRWQGIQTVDLLTVRDALGRRPHTSDRVEEAFELARELRAGRVVRSQLLPSTNGVTLVATLLDSNRGEALTETRLPLADSSFTSATVYEQLADSLLLLRGGAPDRPLHARETRSLEARRAFLRGRTAVLHWDLHVADSSFQAAARIDPEYTRALLWLAQVRAWSGAPATEWQQTAARVREQPERLLPSERLLAEALLDLGAERYPEACRRFRQLIDADSSSFEGWFGLGECLRRDPIVIHDRQSPSGWAFRSSYASAVDAYRHALSLVPSSNTAFRENSFGHMRDVMFTRASNARQGRLGTDANQRFIALADWDQVGDTLRFIPRPIENAEDAPIGNLSLALAKMRRIYLGVAEAWSHSQPMAADALEALSIAEASLGDPRALAAGDSALALSRDPEQRLRLRLRRAVLLLLGATPSDRGRMATIRGIAEQALRERVLDGPDALLSYEVAAAILGDPNLSASIVRRRAMSERESTLASELPPALVTEHQVLERFAAFGGPTDSIRAALRRFDAALRATSDAQGAAPLREVLLARSALLTDATSASPILGVPPGNDRLLLARAALRRGDRETSVKLVDDEIGRHRSTPAAERTVDVILAEGSLLRDQGRAAEAAHWIDESLDALAFQSPDIARQPSNIAALIRLLLLRGEIARTLPAEREGAIGWLNATRILRGTSS